MAKPLYGTVLVTLLVCFSVFVGSKLHGQAQASTTGVPDRAFQLAEEKMEVSKLDWILLTARIRAMEQIIAHEGSRPASPIGMRYDRDAKRVIVRGFVDPSWVDSAKLDEIRKLLSKQGTDYCVDGLMMAEAEMGEVLAARNVGTDCSIEFVTWTTNKAGELAPKDVAVMEKGQLILK